ncbi:MAG: acyl phosphate:glycerol-3-phosphate acyltransferase [Acidimicrobiaceae bacterium]|nr:acyl phosphate:glycerol-3-phosphate acyltransferase [Acidimicrobiaceae bacterium]
MAPMAVALTIAAYLLGTFPTAVLVARAKGHDVTQEGSGNPGATNVYRVAGRRAAMFVFAGDLFKGVIAAGVGLAVADRTTALAMGAAAVVGHCLPVTRRFKGGKGVATAAGFAVVIEPVIGLVAGVCWLIVLKATKRASLASLAIVVALPLAVLARRGPHIEALVVSLVAVFIVSRHARNIARLVRGEEASLRGVERSG